jgi:hypothetical protein
MKALCRASLAALVLASATACTASDPPGHAGSGLSAYRGRIDSTLVPPEANRDGLFISNEIGHGG